MSNFFNTLKNNIGISLLITLDLLLVLLLYYLSTKKMVSDEFFYIGSIAFLGWLFTFWINMTVQNKEIKKRLEIEAFKEVNKMIEEINLASSEIGAYYGYELIKEFSPDRDPLSLSKLANYTKLNKEMEDKLLTLWIKFRLKIRAHEIVLIRFNDLKNKLDLKFKKSVLLTSEFVNYTQKIIKKNSLAKNELLEIKNKCIKIDKSLSNLGHGLTDYGIELQNEMLGEIFNSKIPKPKNKKPHKTFAQFVSYIYKQNK